MRHPRVCQTTIERQRPAAPEPVRVCVYVSDPLRRAWVESELQTSGVVTQMGRTVEELVAALVDDPPPRPQVVVADLEDMTPEELARVAHIRQLGWFGTMFAIGRTSMAVRKLLGIDRVFSAPLPRNGLRAAISGMSHDAQTLRIARVIG